MQVAASYPVVLNQDPFPKRKGERAQDEVGMFQDYIVVWLLEFLA